MWRHAFLHGLALVTPSLLASQAPTDSAAALRLAERATALRAALERDTSLRSWRATAHGFVFFLAQVGAGRADALADAPRLVKADELEVEVYWCAPGPHKQVVRRWRDGRWLPSDLHYHRDHLGIVTGDFGPRIRLGEGDEVRDVPHPLSAEGLRFYAFGAGELLRIRTPEAEVVVRVLTVRPRDPSRPGVIGELYLDANTAELVRFRFGFTAAAYRDRDVEDITVVLENGRWEGRWWLPVRQEIEIRRRAAWLDFPMRGIIRGRWEIGDYTFNKALPESVLRGPAIGGLVEPDNDAGGWSEPLAQAIEAAEAPAGEEDLAELRRELEEMKGAQVIAGLPGSRPAAGSVSEIVRVTRVEGLAPGFGWTFATGRAEIEPRIGYGFSGVGVNGGLRVGVRLGAVEPWIEGRRRARDVNDFRVIAPLLNSILAQEGGNDHGDWVLEEAVEAGVGVPRGKRMALGAAVAFDRTESLAVEAEPSSGEYRPNPSLGEGDAVIARTWVERREGGKAGGREVGDWYGMVEVEGSPDERWVRGRISGEATSGVGGGEVLLRLEAIWGSAHLPAWRSIALGGRGTLVGEEYRSLGGLRGGVAHLEWRLPVAVPKLRSVTLAPFAATGWADGRSGGQADRGVPWEPSDGLRPVLGVAFEVLMRLVRVEAGVALRTGEWGVTADVSRAWWSIL